MLFLWLPGKNSDNWARNENFYCCEFTHGYKKVSLFSHPEQRDDFIAWKIGVYRFGYILSTLHYNDNATMAEKGKPGFDQLFNIIHIHTLNYWRKRSRNLITHQKKCQLMRACWSSSSICQLHLWKLSSKFVHALKSRLSNSFEIYTVKHTDKVEAGLGEWILL